MRRFQNPAVKQVFDAYPPSMRKKLLALRELIFEVAAVTDGVGRLQETLKWSEPAYVTVETKSGSTIRIDSKEATPTQYAIYFHCQTNLVETFRQRFAGQLLFEGNRAIVFKEEDELPIEHVAWCIAAALTYHLRKPLRSKQERDIRKERP